MPISPAALDLTQAYGQGFCRRRPAGPIRQMPRVGWTQFSSGDDVQRSLVDGKSGVEHVGRVPVTTARTATADGFTFTPRPH
jgi:hypothetical protein